MLKLVVSLFITLVLCAQSVQTFRMNDKPRTSNGVILTELGTMRDTEDGFYQAIDTSVSEDGKVTVLDKGNFRIHVFEMDGTHVLDFGKEGQGPGELTRAGLIYAFNERILIQKNDRIILFDYAGKLVTEINERTFGASLYKTPKGFKYVFDGTGRPNRILSKEFDFNGKKIAEILDPDFEEKNKRRPKSRADYLSRIGEFTKQRFESPRDLSLYNDGYMRHYQGEYKIEKLDKNMNVIATITRPFIRVKENYDQLQALKERIKDLPEERKKQIIATTEARLVEEAKFNHGYKNDIQELIGTYKGYIFVSVASEKDRGSINTGLSNSSLHDIQVDVISPDNELYATIDAASLNMESMEDLNWITIIEDKMVFEMHNDTEGPYVKIIDIKINDSVIATN